MRDQVMLDIETVGKFDNSVLLSIAAIPFSLDEKPESFQELLDRETNLFIKFRVKDQIKGIDCIPRYFDTDTAAWWKKQGSDAIEVSVLPKDSDLGVFEGLTKLKDWCARMNPKVVWTRGNLDFSVIQHIWETSGMHGPCPIHYTSIRDVRTAVDLLYGSSNGYVKTEVPAVGLCKHDPTHDCALDILMLTRGITP